MSRRRFAADDMITMRLPLNRFSPKNGEYFEVQAPYSYLRANLADKLLTDYWKAPASKEQRLAVAASTSCENKERLDDPKATPADFGGLSDTFRGYKQTEEGKFTVWYHYAGPAKPQRTRPFSRRVGKG